MLVHPLTRSPVRPPQLTVTRVDLIMLRFVEWEKFWLTLSIASGCMCVCVCLSEIRVYLTCQSGRTHIAEQFNVRVWLYVCLLSITRASTEGILGGLILCFVCYQLNCRSLCTYFPRPLSEGLILTCSYKAVCIWNGVIAMLYCFAVPFWYTGKNEVFSELSHITFQTKRNLLQRLKSRS